MSGMIQNAEGRVINAGETGLRAAEQAFMNPNANTGGGGNPGAVSSGGGLGGMLSSITSGGNSGTVPPQTGGGGGTGGGMVDNIVGGFQPFPATNPIGREADKLIDRGIESAIGGGNRGGIIR